MALKILLIILTGSSGVFGVSVMVLFMIGLWRMFEKSGIKGWWALIPGAREYQLARCAGRESEGPGYALVMLGSIALSIASLIANTGESIEVGGYSTIDIVIVTLFRSSAENAMLSSANTAPVCTSPPTYAPT